MNSERVGAARLRTLEQRLSPRDWLVLRSLDQHRFLVTSQVQRLHFEAHRSESAGIRACIRTLDRLRSLGLVSRLPRGIGGLDGGSRGFVWSLDHIGRRLLRREESEPPPRRRRFEPTVLFLEHTLAVAELRVRLEEVAREGHIELEHVETEPACWREYISPHGAPGVLKPDLAVVTATGDYEDHYFLEVDRGTESIRTTLIAKCAQYVQYRQTGREQADAGVFPLVVWIMPDETRRARFVRELTANRAVDPDLFRVLTDEEFIPLVTGDSRLTEHTTTAESASTSERRNQ